MKKLLWGFAVVLTASIIVIACQKEASPPDDGKGPFDEKAALYNQINQDHREGIDGTDCN